MAVYTEVPQDEAAALLRALNLGELTALRGIHGGIENTNYFATTVLDGVETEHVLTVFERLGFEQLPYYLRLMKHLATRGIPVPEPAADAKGELLHKLQGKPAAVVNKLHGRSELAPAVAHCTAVGAMLARMHLAGRDFELQQPNLRGLPWWNETTPVVLPHLDADQSALLKAELAFQNHVASLPAYKALPRGPVHADLFRDNVMFDGETLCGFFDFYFAGNDSFLFDLAVTLNDWCIFHGDLGADGMHDEARAQAMLAAYQSVRPLSAAERQLLPAMLRAGALRFWLSRLWDWYLPREASMLKPHDPTHFERVLRERLQQASQLSASAIEAGGVPA
ncbi:homoserine kinase [Hydrogenophaga sp. RWCD_12]|uniref:homoserine kinase n=1 Tax=Hydrogenophaga sp. RWCD_12 TaxID=3391190 RepID=UPI00398468E7